MKEIIALQQYTDKHISLYEGEIRNIEDRLADQLIAKNIVAEHTEGSGGSKLNNFVDGIAMGSVRSITSTKESNEYKLGFASCSQGAGTKASGDQSHAEGFVTEALGDCSHAEGSGTKALGDYSHAEGAGGTTASGVNSHAEGTNTTASGPNSHAENAGTTASGVNSHAEGTNTTTSGLSSHAEGTGTIASGQYSHVQGKYNIQDNNDTYAFIIGNGSEMTRSNAFAMKWDGTFVFANGTQITPSQFASLKALLNV